MSARLVRRSEAGDSGKAIELPWPLSGEPVAQRYVRHIEGVVGERSRWLINAVYRIQYLLAGYSVLSRDSSNNFEISNSGL